MANRDSRMRMGATRWPRPAWLLAGLLLLLLAGCQHEAPLPWRLHDIRGHMPDLAFRLTDDTGKPATAADFRGKDVLLYFGYTHCPDVCPLTLAHLHAAMQRLGKRADDFRILFVTVDPARDTPALMHSYVRAFDKHAVGLTGAPSTIEALAKRYRSAFSREPGNGDGQYEVSHSSAIFVFDRQGRARLLSTPISSRQDMDNLVHDLVLLHDSGD